MSGEDIMVSMRKDDTLENNLIGILTRLSSQLGALTATVEEQNKSLIDKMNDHSERIKEIDTKVSLLEKDVAYVMEKADCIARPEKFNSLYSDVQNLQKKTEVDAAGKSGFMRGINLSAKAIYGIVAVLVAGVMLLINNLDTIREWIIILLR